MARFVPVKEAPGFVKDTSTGSILNTDNVGLAAYKRQKKHAQSVNDLAARVDKIEKDVGDIKSLLHQILGKFE